jgi:hypothetical protein
MHVWRHLKTESVETAFFVGGWNIEMQIGH